MKPTGRVSLISISFMSTRTLPKWLCRWGNRRRRRQRSQTRRQDVNGPQGDEATLSEGHPTHVFFREHPGEAQVPGHLGFEKPVFPEVGVEAICCRRNLEESQPSVHAGWTIQMFYASSSETGPATVSSCFHGDRGTHLPLTTSYPVGALLREATTPTPVMGSMDISDRASDSSRTSGMFAEFWSNMTPSRQTLR